jgi:hypothetical protein
VPVVINVDINPAVINSGGSAALIWRVSGANSVSIDQGIGNVSLNGERLVSPTATTTYIITATGNAGTVSKSVVLTVNPPVVATFTVDPSTISAGQLATLQWNVTGATSVSIDQGIGKVAPVSSKVVSPYYTTTYTLTASSSCCTISKSVVLTVGRYYPYWGPYGYDYMYPYMHEYPYMYGRPFIDILNITPSTITSGDSATLSWYVTGASSVFITGIGNVSSSGSRVVSPSSTTTYTMTASNYYGTTTGSVTVNVE